MRLTDWIGTQHVKTGLDLETGEGMGRLDLGIYHNGPEPSWAWMVDVVRVG